MIDVTERKRAEDALRNSERRYHAVVEDQTDFIVRWLPDGMRTFANRSYCEYFGQTLEEVKGTRLLRSLDQLGKVGARSGDHSLFDAQAII